MPISYVMDVPAEYLLRQQTYSWNSPTYYSPQKALPGHSVSGSQSATTFRDNSNLYFPNGWARKTLPGHSANVNSLGAPAPSLPFLKQNERTKFRSTKLPSGDIYNENNLPDILEGDWIVMRCIGSRSGSIKDGFNHSWIELISLDKNKSKRYTITSCQILNQVNELLDGKGNIPLYEVNADTNNWTTFSESVRVRDVKIIKSTGVTCAGYCLAFWDANAGPSLRNKTVRYSSYLSFGLIEQLHNTWTASTNLLMKTIVPPILNKFGVDK